MSKIYVGYLYQIEEGSKLVHSDKNKSSHVAPIQINGGYFLYEKCLFQKKYVREIITGKKIPVVAADTMHLKGLHTFMKYDGRIYQKKTTATVEEIEVYMKNHPDKEKFKSNMKKIFAFGKAKAHRGFSVRRNQKNTENQKLNSLEDELKTGSYQKRVDKIAEPEPDFVYKQEINRMVNSEYSGSGAGMGMPQHMSAPGMPGMSGMSEVPGMFDISDMQQNSPAVNPINDYDLNNSQRRGNLKQSKPIIIGEEETSNNVNSRTVQKLNNVKPESNKPTPTAFTQPKSNVVVSGDSTPLKNVEEPKIDIAQETVLNSADLVQDSNIENKKSQNVQNNYTTSEKKRTIVTTFGRENTDVIKELAEIAGKGGEAVATIEGVEVSTKYLVSEKDLTEYFLAKRYNRTPESLTVRAVLANEESMNIVNKSRSL